MRSRSALRPGLFLITMIALAAETAGAQALAPGNPLDQLPVPTPLPAPSTPMPRVEGRAPPGAAASKLDRQVTPTRIDVAGASDASFGEIATAFSQFVRQQVTVAELVTAAADATQRYRSLGLPLSFVFLPDQDFAGGVVRVVAVEGFIERVRIEGDAGPAEPQVRRVAEQLLAERPLTQAGFERVTGLLAQLPGLTVSADATMPSTTNGATTLNLRVKRSPYNLLLGADVRSPAPRLVATGVWSDPTLAGSEVNASTLVGDWSREKMFGLSYAQKIGADGLALQLAATHYNGYPDETMGRGATIERLNTNDRVDVLASYPWLLNARSSITLNGGFYLVDNTDAYRVPLTGARRTEETRVRALSLQLAYANTAPERSRSASVLLARGIDGAGASSTVRSNRPGLSESGNVDLDFTRIALDASQRDRFANQWGTAVSLGGQYSRNSLAASERVSFGGPHFARAYAAGDAVGDTGWGLGIEVNRLYARNDGWLSQIEPFTSFESAHVSTHIGEPVPGELRSVALGVRLRDNRHYNLELALAKPVGDPSASNPSRRARMSLLLTYQLSRN